MDWLHIAQRAAQECDVTAPSLVVVTGLPKNIQRIVDWTASAWLDIQRLHKDWDWMRQSTSFTTTLNLATYPLGTGAGTCGVSVATFGQWDRDTFRSYLTSVGTNDELFLDYVPYDYWRNVHMFGALRAQSTRPIDVSISPTKAVLLGPPPLSGYTITGDYFTAPLEFANATDIPALPAEFHIMIAWKACMYYGEHEGAAETYNKGERGYNECLGLLEADRTPEITLGGPLA